MSVKYIFVTGGVVSGLGKGITAASLGRLLKERGYKVTMQKFDPYINVNPGTMSPYQHGEVFVTDDGAETDLDVGHYERFIDENLTINADVTAGQIYWTVLNKERRGEYEGRTVQVIPHITDEIKSRIYRAGGVSGAQIVITEIGGTVGDIECQPFLETIREVQAEKGRENVMFIHVTLVPYVSGSNELKSKATQHSVKELLSMGVQPNVIVCRADYPIPEEMRQKLSLFCNVRREDVIHNMTVDCLYEAPIMLEEQGLARSVCHCLGLGHAEPDLSAWRAMVSQMNYAGRKVTVGVVGKYVESPDAYISIVESLRHGAIRSGVQVNIKLIDSVPLTDKNIAKALNGCDGVLVPAGFGDRGTLGKISAIQYARTNRIPFLGIGLGMQMAVVEYAKNILEIESANSVEVDPSAKHPVVHIMPVQPESPTPEQNSEIEKFGGVMRLGLHSCVLAEDSIAREAYGRNEVSERHRHRYTVNNKYMDKLAKAGMVIAGVSSDDIVEIVELPRDRHPWFVGVQFHPEFKSRPNRPHPLFEGFVKAALEQNNK